MSQEPKNNEEGFMYKLASFIVDKRNLIFLIVAIGLVFSAFSRNWVQVENQLSAYLPKDSETYKGLHLMEDEFITFGTAKIMLVNVTYDEAQAVSERLEAVDGVQSVTFDDTKEQLLMGFLPMNCRIILRTSKLPNRSQTASSAASSCISKKPTTDTIKIIKGGRYPKVPPVLHRR